VLDGFLSGSNWIWLSLALPIVFCYLLKVRRTPQAVSALFLWRQVLVNAKVDSFWQRLRNQLFLWLHLLLLLGLVIALCRPYQFKPGRVGRQVALIFDLSASMSAVDGTPEARVRFERARQTALDTVAQAPDDTQFLVAALSQTPRIILPLNQEPEKTRAAIAALQWEAVETDFSQVLPLCQSISRSNPQCQLLLFTDQEASAVSKNAGLTLINCFKGGSDSPALNNLALENFQIQKLPTAADQTASLRGFASVHSYSQHSNPVSLRLLDSHGTTLMTRTLLLEAGQRKSLNFDLEAPAEESNNAYRLTIETPDGLEVDNEAWAVLQSNRGASLDPESKIPDLLHPALLAQPRISKENDGVLIKVWDGFPTQLPAGIHIVLHKPSSADNKALDFLPGNSTEIQGLPLQDLFGTPPVDIPYRNWSSEPWAIESWLVAGQPEKPVLARLSTPTRQVLVLASDLSSSNLVLQPALPVLIGRFIDTFLDDAKSASVRCGQEWIWSELPGKHLIQLDTPQGTIEPKPHFRPGRPGLYRAVWKDSAGAIHKQPWVASFVSNQESNLRQPNPLPSANLNANAVTPAEEHSQQLLTLEYWRWAVWLVLLISLAEWWLLWRPTQPKSSVDPS
jgi:Ca-activated chloride channel family protein